MNWPVDRRAPGAKRRDRNWKPEDAHVRQGASGESYLVISANNFVAKVLIGGRIVEFAGANGKLWMVGEGSGMVFDRPMVPPFGEQLDHRPGEAVLEAFLRQS